MNREKRNIKVAEFFKTERSKLIRFVQRLINDAAAVDSEDIIQDVMLNIFDMGDITIPIDNLAAYIYQSLRHRIIDIFKQKKYDSFSMDDNFNGNVPYAELYSDKRYNTETEVEHKETREAVFSAIDSLSDDYKEVVLLTEFGGKSFQELSDEKNIPIGTLLSRKSRAMDILRKRLKYEFGG